jgi:hypothetical protein
LKITGKQVWLKAIQDTADNLATGITFVKQWGDYVFAVGGHESNDYTLVFYMLNFETGELTDRPRKIDFKSIYNDIAPGAKLVINDASQVSTFHTAKSSDISFAPRQEVNGQFNGRTNYIRMYFNPSENTINRFY